MFQFQLADVARGAFMWVPLIDFRPGPGASFVIVSLRERENAFSLLCSSEVRLSNYVTRTAFISQANAANWSSNCARHWLRRLARKPFKCCTHPHSHIPHTHTWVGTIKGKLKAKDEDEFTPTANSVNDVKATKANLTVNTKDALSFSLSLLLPLSPSLSHTRLDS